MWTRAVDNTATASGTPPTGADVTATDTTRPRSRGTRRSPGQAGRHAVRHHGRLDDRLHVRGDQHRQRDARPVASTVGTDLPGATLAPGATTCTATYTMTRRSRLRQCELRPRPDAPATADSADTTDTPIAPVRRSAGQAAGTRRHRRHTIAYSFLVTNTGNVTLTGVAVADPQVGGVLPGDHAGAGCVHDLHGDVHADPGRRGRRDVSTTPRRRRGTARSAPADRRRTRRRRRSRPDPAITLDKQAGVPSGNAAGDTIDYTLRGDQHRQRDARPGQRRRPDDRAR